MGVEDNCECRSWDYGCLWCSLSEGWWYWLGANLEVAAAMEIVRQTYYRRGFENAMAIKGICEPLKEEHAQRILTL